MRHTSQRTPLHLKHSSTSAFAKCIPLLYLLVAGLSCCTSSELLTQDASGNGAKETSSANETVLAKAPSRLGWTRFRHWEMLAPPQDGKPGILKLQGKEDSDTVWYVQPGKKPKRVWSAYRYVGVLPAPDGSGMFIVERRHDAAHWLEITKISLFDEQGKRVSSFKPKERIQLLAALANNELLARTSDGHQSTLIILDKQGKTIASTGPVVFKSCQSNADATRVLVDVPARDVTTNLSPEPQFPVETTAVVMMNVREGTMLHEYPKADLSQMSGQGNTVVQYNPGNLTIFSNGKLQQSFSFARRFGRVTFSKNERWLGFAAEGKYHLYDLESAKEAFALEEKDGFRFVFDKISVSNDGTSIVLVFREGSPIEWKVLLLDAVGRQMWSMNAIATGGLRIAEDGKTAFICTRDRLLQVHFGP